MKVFTLFPKLAGQFFFSHHAFPILRQQVESGLRVALSTAAAHVLVVILGIASMGPAAYPDANLNFEWIAA